MGLPQVTTASTDMVRRPDPAEVKSVQITKLGGETRTLNLAGPWTKILSSTNLNNPSEMVVRAIRGSPLMTPIFRSLAHGSRTTGDNSQSISVAGRYGGVRIPDLWPSSCRNAYDW
jgi:hypothetical protein